MIKRKYQVHTKVPIYHILFCVYQCVISLEIHVSSFYTTVYEFHGPLKKL